MKDGDFGVGGKSLNLPGRDFARGILKKQRKSRSGLNNWNRVLES